MGGRGVLGRQRKRRSSSEFPSVVVSEYPREGAGEGDGEAVLDLAPAEEAVGVDAAQTNCRQRDYLGVGRGGSQEACFDAITAEVFCYWASGPSRGPDNFPATTAELPEQHRKPYPGA
jgi:hypothetical protein